MVFVPTVSYIPPQQASLEAQELAREIEYAIAEYQEDHPRVRQEDIQQALQLAYSRGGAATTGKAVVMVAIAVGLSLLAVLATIFLVLA